MNTFRACITNNLKMTPNGSKLHRTHRYLLYLTIHSNILVFYHCEKSSEFPKCLVCTCWAVEPGGGGEFVLPGRSGGDSELGWER